MLLGGIDIGGTKIAVGVSDADGGLLASRRVPTADPEGPANALARALLALRECVPEGGQLGAVGVASCGPLDSKTGVILTPPNLPDWHGLPLVQVLEAELGIPVALENDCNAAALGEHRFGAGQGVDDLLYVTLSTGIGSGLILGGRLHRGLRDSAGEIGHQTVDPRGAQCPCGNHGCLELLAGGPAIARRAREALASGRASSLAPDCEAAQVIAAAGEGDPLAHEVWVETLEWLSIGLGNAITTLAPQRVLIGGGVSAAGEDLLFEPLRERLRRRVRLVPVEQVEIMPAANPLDACLIGALAIARGLV